MSDSGPVSAARRVRAKAGELGFDAVGIARAQPLDKEGEHLREWLARGYQGGMGWMARDPERRADPQKVLPGARSVIAVAMNYYTQFPHTDDREHGKISRYAWGDDYHDILGGRLQVLANWLALEFPGSRGKTYVDTGPVMDKAWAQRAGIGWLGKHTNIITQEIGSWVFLGEVLTTLELEPDKPALDHCGSCTLCIEACPTGAIVEPYVVDSNRCISYLTIEHRGEIPEHLAADFEGWIYGCDICQDVCPWNRKFAAESPVGGFAPREGNQAPVLAEWETMSAAEFQERFRRSPVKRTKHDGLLRNIRLVRQRGSSS